MSKEKSLEDIKAEYKIVLFRAKIASGIFVLLWLPKLIVNYTDQSSLLGISETTWFGVAVVAFIAYLVFFKLYWKCPNCGKFPGGGWHRLSCKLCGVALWSRVT